MKKVSKKTTAAPVAPKKAPRERDKKTGRFKTLVGKVAKKFAAKVPAKPKAEKKPKPIVKPERLIKCNALDKLIDRSGERAKIKGGPIYLKIVNPKVPAVENHYGGTIRDAHRFSVTEVMLIDAYAYGQYNNLTYVTPRGKIVMGYFSNDYEFLQVAQGDEDFDKMTNIFAECKIKLLHRELEHDFEIGCDPEIFVEKKEGGLIPAFLFLPPKEKAAKTPNDDHRFNRHGGCDMFWDGFQAEFATRPDHCLGYHGDSIAAGLQGIYDSARRRFPDAKLSSQSVFVIAPEILATADDQHVNFGCMPSLNIYGLKVKSPPARQVPFRSAGGHIHFGIGKSGQKDAEKIVKALDAILGVACVSLFAEFDDPSRRVLYGLPGEYRLPPHGLEYRPLSNAWLVHPMIMNLVIDLSRKCLVFGQKDLMQYWDATEEETIDCIIRCDVEAAHRILIRNKEVFKQLLKASYYENDDGDEVDVDESKSELNILFNVFINGIRSAIKDPTDFVTNWKLEEGWQPHSGGYDEPNVRTYLDNRRGNAKYRM